jgi:hypothetical protein
MSNKKSTFYRGSQNVFVNFLSEEISFDGVGVNLEILKRKYVLLKRISEFIPDDRNRAH